MNIINLSHFYCLAFSTHLKLGIPFIINSKSFHPLKERIGIYLNTENENSLLAKQNVELIVAAFAMYREFVENCKNENYNNLEHLLGFNQSYNYDWNDEAFINSHITTTIDFLIDKELVLLNHDENGEPIFASVNNIDIPTPDKNKDFDVDHLFSLTKVLELNSVPSENIWRVLLEYRTNWKTINRKFDALKCDWTISSVLDEIASFNSTAEIIQHYSFPSEDVFFAWHNSIFDLVKTSSVKDSITNISCMPDQQGKFKKCAVGQLFFDEVRIDALKDIAHLSTYEVRSFLVHDKVAKRHDDLFVKFDTKELLTKLLDILFNKKQDFNKVTELDKNPLVLLLDWAFDNNEHFAFVLSKLPLIFATNEDEVNKFDPRILNKDEKVLIPATLWPEKLQFYSKLVSSKFLLSEIYSPVFLKQDRINILSDTGLFYISPLYYEDCQLKREEIKYLTDANDTKKLMEQTEKWEYSTVRLARLAWFESGDSLSVLQRQSQKRTKLIIEFLFEHLIDADHSWETKISLPSNPDLNISVLSSLWLCKLNTNRWVYSSSGNENPDANNFSIYLKDMGFQQTLKKTNVTKFLNALKLPVSDIIKQVLIKSEEEGVAWDTVYASMVQGSVAPNEAGEMLQDESVIDFYRKKKENAAYVNKNKKIGERFENELNNLFRSDEFSALGFKIRREPIGSDFVVGVPPEDVIPEEDIFSDEYNGGAIFILEGQGKIFLELKATNGDSVSMTRAQADKATKNPDNYCLAIFKYTSQEDINATNILEKAIFIDSIGTDLSGPFNRHAEIQNEVDIERSGTDIAVETEFGKVRFRINKPIWKKGKTFQEFIRDFLTAMASE